MISGADRFLTGLEQHDIPYMVLTNNSIYTPGDLAARLHSSGLDIAPAWIWASATATTHFLSSP